jgi:hypothetical protein
MVFIASMEIATQLHYFDKISLVLKNLVSPLDIILYFIILPVVDVIANVLRVCSSIPKPNTPDLAGLVKVQTGTRCTVHGNAQCPQEQNGLNGYVPDPFL